MPQPGYCSVVFGVLRDFGDIGQAIGWRKRKISTDYNKIIVVQLPFVERSMRKTLSSGSSSITLLHRAMWTKRRLTNPLCKLLLEISKISLMACHIC